MSSPIVYPVILCGGSGTRLWPLSRESYPKQFAPLLGPRSLFQETVLRVAGPTYATPLVLTAEAFRFIVLEQCEAVGQDRPTVLIEPAARNTAPAILTAALHLENDDPDAVMLVAPSDHVMPDTESFAAAVRAGLAAIDAGRMVTFGITPTRAETGYGYLELDGDAQAATVPLRQFVEKPDAQRAAEMVADGNFLWNAGIFMFRVRDFVAEVAAHAPDLMAPARAALDGAERDLGFLRLAADPWAGMPDISVDYAVMEKSDRLSVVPYSGGWSDLGSWDAVHDAMAQDDDAVAVSGDAIGIGCRNTLLRAESEGQCLVGLGLDNIVAVAMDDAVLVADRSAAQDVKKVVSALKSRSVPQARTLPRDHRPWGWFESLVVGERFQVKRIVVKPGAALSLQSHVHRSEHWIVVAGTARVTVGETVQLVGENQSVYIPLGAVHRMENPGKLPMVLIEVQTGSYLGEDDIVRYEDVYARK